MMKHLAILAFASLLVSGCSDSKPAATVLASNVTRPAVVAPPADDLNISGPITVENQVDVSAQHDGVVTKVTADTGTLVKKGQLLAVLDDRQLAAERDAAQAKMRSVSADVKNWESETKVQEIDLNRAQKMLEAGVMTKQDVDHAQYKVDASRFEVERERQNLKNAEATLQSLQLEFEKTHIVAPFDGVVARRYVRAGQKVSKDDRMFWVTATSPMFVRFALPEKFAGRVSKGSEITVVAAAFPDEKHRAKVITVSPVVDPASGTIEISAEIAGKTGSLKPGMTANIQLPANQ